MMHSANTALKAWMTATFDAMERLGAFRSAPTTAAMPAGYVAALKKQQDGKK